MQNLPQHLNTLGIRGYCLISLASLMENWFTHYQHRAAQVTLSLGTRSPNHFLGSTAACRQGQPRQGTDTAPPAAAALCWAVLCPCAAVLCCYCCAAALLCVLCSAAAALLSSAVLLCCCCTSRSRPTERRASYMNGKPRRQTTPWLSCLPCNCRSSLLSLKGLHFSDQGFNFTCPSLILCLGVILPSFTRKLVAIA